MIRLVGAALFAVLLAPWASAQIAGESATTVDQFEGQNNYIDSARLKPSMSQSAVNVMTEHGYIERRPGSALVATFPGAIENFSEFVKSAGTRLLVGHSSASLYSTDLGGVVTAYSTVTANSLVDFVVAYNKIIAVDGTTEVEYDGASTSTSAGFPGCAFVEFMLNRIWCAKISAETNSIVRISSVGASNYWTVPVTPSAIPDAPNFFYIQRDDGYPITCFKKTPWGMVVGKRRSMWVIKGTDNTNWYVRSIDPAIGCVDDRTMQIVDGRLQWLSTDGVYSWDGVSGVKIESLEIESTIKLLRQATSQSNSWGLDSQSDFAAGVFTVPGSFPTSATIVPGSVVNSSWTRVMPGLNTTDWVMVDVDTTVVPVSLNVSNQDGVGLDSRWTVYIGSVTNGGGYMSGQGSGASVSAPQTSSTGVWSVTMVSTAGSSGFIEFWYVAADTVTTFNGLVRTAGAFAVRISNSGYDMIRVKQPDNLLQVIATSTTAGPFDSIAHTFIMTRSTSGFMAFYDNGNFIMSAGSTYPVFTPAYFSVKFTDAGDKIRLSQFKFPDFYTYQRSVPYWTGLSTNVFGSYSINVTSSSVSSVTFAAQFSTAVLGPYTSFYAESLAGTFSATSSTMSYFRTSISPSAPSSTFTITVSSFSLYSAATGYYSSPVDFVGSDISSWGNFDGILTTMSGSSVTFWVRQATYSFSASNTSIAWTGQQPAALVALSVSTPTYGQWQAFMNVTNPALGLGSINLVRLNWNSGLATASAASAFLNHRYLLCVAISSSVNDTCLIQQRTRNWVTMNGQNIGALTLYNNDIFGGDATSSGKVWRELQDGLYNDDGAAISSCWTTPDMMFGDPVSRKVMSEIWVDAQTSTGTLLSVGYAVDKSTTYFTKTLNLGLDPMVVNRRVPLDAGRVTSKYVNFKFCNAQSTSLRINAWTTFYSGQQRRD